MSPTSYLTAPPRAMIIPRATAFHNAFSFHLLSYVTLAGHEFSGLGIPVRLLFRFMRGCANMQGFGNLPERDRGKCQLDLLTRKEKTSR